VRRAIGYLLLPVLLALAACTTISGTGGSSGPSGSAGPPSTSPSATPPSASPSEAPVPGSSTSSAALVQFERQGGFAGLSDQLVIRDDGSYTLVRANPPTTKTGRLTAAELAQLRQALADSGFAALPQVQASGKGADLYTYRVTYQGRTIMAQDGSVAPALKPALAVLAGIVARYSA
jgi:hypothetical protein